MGVYIPTEPETFRTFVTESNRIEGITRRARIHELRAHALLLAEEELLIFHFQTFVRHVQPGAVLRAHRGMDVRVGAHVAPPGGPWIGSELDAILQSACDGEDPFKVHQAYEHLHPFMDGNGRSGRALWLWQMIRQRNAGHAMRMGFLHLWYYQSLSAWRSHQDGER